MKIGILGFGERNLIPYIETYENELKKANIQYDCIFWDRCNNSLTSKNNNEYTVHIKCEPGISKFKKIIPMLKFKRQIEKILQKEQYTHLIILTTLPGVLIYKYLLKHYSDKYILDIRDYSYEKYEWYKKIVGKLIEKSYFTAISSNGFKVFLPQSDKIIICHNIGVNFREEKEVINLKSKEKITIGFVGAVRYFEEDCKVIKTFANNSKYQLVYIGKRNLDCDLEGYCKKNNIKNVVFQGEFKNADKPEIYKQIDVINAIYGNTSLEVKTLLPNRLYDGILFKKPILASKGTYFGDVVDEYKLGLTLDINTPIDQIVRRMDSYIRKLDNLSFLKHCELLERIVNQEQKIFIKEIRAFIGTEKYSKRD